MNLFYLLKPKSTVCYVEKGDLLRDGLEKIRESGFTAIPVIDDSGEYIGTVSEGDFLWFLLQYGAHCQDEYRIVDIVNEERNLAVRTDTTMEGLLMRVMEQSFVPVVDDRKMFIGIITRRDIIRYFYDNTDKKEAAE